MELLTAINLVQEGKSEAFEEIKYRFKPLIFKNLGRIRPCYRQDAESVFIIRLYELTLSFDLSRYSKEEDFTKFVFSVLNRLKSDIFKGYSITCLKDRPDHSFRESGKGIRYSIVYGLKDEEDSNVKSVSEDEIGVSEDVAEIFSRINNLSTVFDLIDVMEFDKRVLILIYEGFNYVQIKEILKCTNAQLNKSRTRLSRNSYIKEWLGQG